MHARNHRIFRNLVWGGPLLWAGVIFWLSSQSELPQPANWMPPFTDKLVHAALYAILSLLVYTALRCSKIPAARAAWLALLGASLYGISDEWHQGFVLNRQPDLLDWLADTVGACVSFAAARWNRSVSPNHTGNRHAG